MKKMLVFLLMGIAGTLTAQETLTFQQAISLALKSNHQIEVARNTAEISDNNATLGNADLLPSFSLSGGANYTDNDGGASTMTSAQISASYTLFDGLGNLYRFKGLRAQGRASRLETRDRIESTLLLVSQTYYSAVSSWENYQIAEELLAISQERLERARQRALYGRARTLDVLAAQVDLSSDSVTVTQSKFFWDEARRQVNVMLNRNVETEFSVDTTIVFLKTFLLPSLKEEALERNAAFLSEGEWLTSTRYDLGAARAAHLPRLDLSSSYGLSPTQSGLAMRLDNPSQSLSAGISVSFNLFDGLKTHIRRQNAQIAFKNQELILDEARLNLEKDVISSYEAYKNSLLVMNLETRSLEAALLNFKRTEELYQLGQVTTTQFREAQLNLIRAKSNLAAAKYEAKLNEITLLKLSGRLLVEETEKD